MEERVYLTVNQFCEKYKGRWPTAPALRAIILDASWGKNNFQPAFKRVGRRILIDVEKFWQCVECAEIDAKVANLAKK